MLEKIIKRTESKDMKKLAYILSRVDALNRWVGYGIMFLALWVIIGLTIESISRYLFNAPIIWAPESVMLVFGVYMLLSGAYVLLIGGHVNMDALYARFPARTKAILDVITSIFFFIFVVALLWKGIPIAIKAVVMQEHSQSVWGAPYWPPRIAIPLGALLILLQGLANLIRNLYFAVSGKKL